MTACCKTCMYLNPTSEDGTRCKRTFHKLTKRDVAMADNGCSDYFPQPPQRYLCFKLPSGRVIYKAYDRAERVDAGWVPPTEHSYLSLGTLKLSRPQMAPAEFKPARIIAVDRWWKPEDVKVIPADIASELDAIDAQILALHQSKAQLLMEKFPEFAEPDPTTIPLRGYQKRYLSKQEAEAAARDKQ